MHELSPYCPICTHCGLILCSLNAPCYSCPHCSTPLLSSTARTFLLERIRNDLAEVIAKEEEEAEHAREEARQAAGAFPTLNSANVSQTPPSQQPQAHKVLSLNSKTKRVTVSSYTPAPKPARPSTLSDEKEREPSPERVPPPLSEMAIARKPPDSGRPWQDMRGDGFVRPLTYVRDPHSDKEQLKKERKARKQSKRHGEDGDRGTGEGSALDAEGSSATQ